MKAIKNQLITPPQHGNYIAPAATLHNVELRRNLCDASPNSAPSYEWGSESDQEPED